MCSSVYLLPFHTGCGCIPCGIDDDPALSLGHLSCLTQPLSTGPPMRCAIAGVRFGVFLKIVSRHIFIYNITKAGRSIPLSATDLTSRNTRGLSRFSQEHAPLDGV